MGFSANIRKTVNRLAAEKADEIAEQTLYNSPQMKAYLQNVSDTLLGNMAAHSIVELANEGLNSDVAYTDGKITHINTSNVVMNFFSSMESRFVALMGIHFHECAHRVFCNFGAENAAIELVKSGKMYGEEPAASELDSEEQQTLVKLLDAMANPNYAEIFATVYAELSNIIADSHDEDCLIGKFGGFVEEGIRVAREALRSQCHSVEYEEAAVKDGNASKLSVMYNLALQFARFGQVVMENEDSLLTSEYMAVLSKCARNVEIAKQTGNTPEKFTQLNRIVLALFPYIEETLDNEIKKQQSSSGNSGNPQSDSSGTQSQANPSSGNSNSNSAAQQQAAQQQAVQQVLSQLAQGAKDSGQTVAPQNIKASKTAKAAEKGKGNTSTQAVQPAGSDPNSQQPLTDALNKIVHALAQQEAENEVERMLASSLSGEISVMDMNSTHKGVPCKVTRLLDVTGHDKAVYDANMRELKSYSRRLQRQIQDALRDLQDGSIAHHKSFGNRVEAQYAYRPDQKYFASRKLPQDLPDMAISILVDHSGSMWGERIKTAMRASMLLYDFATSLGIPVAVSGHDTSGSTVNYLVYTDFEKVSNNDRYRLSQMEAGGANRDGMAIDIAANLLSKRSEAVKLLFVISDGRPNHDRYGGESAAGDIRSIVRKHKHQGIEVIACAIGDDKDKIKAIYEKDGGFLDVSSLDTLPKMLTTLVKKRLLQHT